MTQARLGQTSEGKTLFLVDETSLAATKDIHEFAHTVKPGDHVIFIGDDAPSATKVGQHTSVDAGRVFQLLQEAGMQTAHFNRVYRQKDPELKKVVLAFRNGQTGQALQLLERQGRIHEAENSRDRFAEIAKVYTLSPQRTLVISPDNQSRMLLNNAIREEMRRQGQLNGAAYELPILVARDLSKAEMKRASSYHLQDVVQYRKGNQAVGVGAREYATVIGRDVEANRLTVKTQAGKVVTYDPSRASGVNVYETRQQEFSAGERIQFTAKDKRLGAHTRDTGTIRSLDENGNVEVVLDRNSKTLKFNLQQHRHVDHAYTMTSHSAQSQTVERVLINVNTSDPRLRGLLNEVFAYVASSRPEFDLRLFADRASELHRVLSRENETQKGLSPEEISRYREQLIRMAQQPVREVEHGYGLGV